MTIDQLNLTPATRDLLEKLVKDAGNWGGTPMLGGNFTFTAEMRGNLTHLKRAGLLTTFRSDGCDWVNFTDLARSLYPELS